MSRELWSYVAGGAGDEHTQTRNVAAFQRWGLMPRMLAGAAERDLSVELFGAQLPTPLMLAPVGVIGLCEPDGHGDLATARAAAATGVPDDRLDAHAGPDGGRRRRARRHPRLVPAVPAERPRADREPRPPGRGRRLLGDRRHARHAHARLAPARPDDRQLPAAQGPVPGQLLLRPGVPGEARGAARGRPRRPRPGCGRRSSATSASPGTTSPGSARSPGCRCCSRASATRRRPPGASTPASTASTARTTAAGRPTAACPRSTACPTSSTPPATRPVVFDSGVRSGPDVVKALALGATAVGVGRPYAYGLAVGGQAGVEHVLRCLLAEIDLTMAIDGYATVADLTPDALRRVR